MLLFAPILSAQYIRADETWRKSVGMLRRISETKERISAIEENLRKEKMTLISPEFRMEKITMDDSESRDAIFFRFEGQELHWILGR